MLLSFYDKKKVTKEIPFAIGTRLKSQINGFGMTDYKVAFNRLFISFACPKETNQRKRQPQIFFGINIFEVAHALQLALPLRGFAQTVMLTFILRLTTSKMLIFLQKRFVRHCSPYGD
jgi:hypothetical protein